MPLGKKPIDFAQEDARRLFVQRAIAAKHPGARIVGQIFDSY
jgi:hypothetical protein